MILILCLVRYFNDVYSLDLRTNQWKMYYYEGDYFRPRANHMGVVIDDGKILIFGGYTEENKYSNELFIFDYMEVSFKNI